MPARTRKVRHDDLTRQKIQTSQLINRLMKHILGEIELSSTQIRGIEILLKKALPDLQAVTLNGELQHKHETVDLTTLNEAELADLERTIAKASITDGSESGVSQKESNKVH